MRKRIVMAGVIGMAALLALTGCRPKGRGGGGQKPLVIPEVPKSFQIAFENAAPYGLDLEQGFVAEGETLAYEDTKAGMETDMATGYFIRAKPGKAAVLYLRHDDIPGGIGVHVLSLQLPRLAVGRDSLSRESFKGVLYIYYYTTQADFFQARRGEGMVAIDSLTADSVKGTIDLALVGKQAAGRVKDVQPKEMRLKLSGRFVLPRKAPKEVLTLQKAREEVATMVPLAGSP